MIAFDLQCAKGHTFEGWFDDRSAFEEQQKNGYLTCPVCDDSDVMIVPSTFAIPRAGKTASAPAKPSQSRNLAVGELSDKIVEFMEQNFDDVGENFAKEALKIHYGVSEPRNIRGVSSPEEEKVLEKEGVALFKVPLPAKKETDDA